MHVHLVETSFNPREVIWFLEDKKICNSVVCAVTITYVITKENIQVARELVTSVCGKTFVIEGRSNKPIFSTKLGLLRSKGYRALWEKEQQLKKTTSMEPALYW